MSRQYLRVCNVVVGKTTIDDNGKAVGKGVAITDLRIQFDINKTLRLTPNTAMIKIFNLSPATENLIKNEFDEVIVNAGYQDSQRLIFAGNIRHVFKFRDGNDWITQIDAADGDDDLRNTIVNASFAAGTTHLQVIDHIVKKFKTTKLGHNVLKDDKRIRGRVVSGPVGKLFEDIAKTSDAHVSIQDGVLQFVPVLATLPTEAIVIRADTGMLNAPEINDKGIKVTCLLNPAIRVDGKIQLDNNDLFEQLRKEREHKPGAKPRKKKELARLDPDGIYKAICVTHKGDTRANEWQTETLCKALGTPIAPGRLVT